MPSPARAMTATSASYETRGALMSFNRFLASESRTDGSSMLPSSQLPSLGCGTPSASGIPKRRVASTSSMYGFPPFTSAMPILRE